MNRIFHESRLHASRRSPPEESVARNMAAPDRTPAIGPAPAIQASGPSDPPLGSNPAELVPDYALDSANATGLDDLARRVCLAPALREHHVWAAVRMLEPRTDLRQHTADFQRFRALMEREAFLDALLLLADRLKPVVELCGLVRSHGLWVCRARFTPDLVAGSPRWFRAVHSDPAAAILSAILIAGGLTHGGRQ